MKDIRATISHIIFFGLFVATGLLGAFYAAAQISEFTTSTPKGRLGTAKQAAQLQYLEDGQAQLQSDIDDAHQDINIDDGMNYPGGLQEEADTIEDHAKTPITVSCANDEKLRWTGAGWACAAETDPTVQPWARIPNPLPNCAATDQVLDDSLGCVADQTYDDEIDPTAQDHARLTNPPLDCDPLSDKLHWTGSAWACEEDQVGAGVETDPTVLTHGRYDTLICDPVESKLHWDAGNTQWTCETDMGSSAQTALILACTNIGKQYVPTRADADDNGCVGRMGVGVPAIPFAACWDAISAAPFASPATSADRNDLGTTPLGTDPTWSGFVLGHDEKLYGIPRNATNILVIDTNFGNATQTTMTADLSGNDKWHGGVLAPNGKIYGIPRNAANILIIDPDAGTAERSAMGLDGQLSDSTKWAGGVLGPDGKIYAIPRNATDILIIDPDAGTAELSNMGADLSGADKWEGGVLAPNGKIYGIPRNAANILIIDPDAGTAERSAMGLDGQLSDSLKWAGGVLGPDGKIYGVPFNSSNILIIDPSNNSASRSTMTASFSGTWRWAGGVLGPDGRIYGMPFHAEEILIIDVVSETAILSTLGASLTGFHKFYGGALAPDGIIYGAMFDSLNTLRIGPFDGNFNAGTLTCPYLNKF